MLEPVFTPEQIIELRKPLDDKTVKHRQGGGGSDLKYLAGFQVIDTANRIFGEGNWGYDLIEVLLNSVSDIKGEVIGGYYSARVKVSVKGCVPVTDEGVCAIQEARNPRAQVDAHDMARKGAITDAMKRAFRCFGNQFGNPLYDKDYGTTQATQPQRQQATTQATRAAVTPNSQQPRVMPTPAPQAPRTVTAPQQAPIQAPTEARLTGQQKSGIFKVGGMKGMEEIELNRRSKELYGKPITDLSQNDASHFIKVLQGMD